MDNIKPFKLSACAVHVLAAIMIGGFAQSLHAQGLLHEYANLTVPQQTTSNCSTDNNTLHYTCSGSASDHVLLDLTNIDGRIEVTVTPDYVSNDSLYIGNKWDFLLGNSSAEPPSAWDNTTLRSDSLSVVLDAGNKLSQYISPEQTDLRRVLFVEAATQKLSVLVNRDIEQALYGSGESTVGYQHAIDIKNIPTSSYDLSADTSNVYVSTENDIRIHGNISQTAINTDNYWISSNSLPDQSGGIIGVSAMVAGIMNKFVLSGNITQDIISDNLYGSFSGSPADIAAIRIQSNSLKNGLNYTSLFFPLAIIEKAINHIDITGAIKQNIAIRDTLMSYVQSGSNYINDAIFVNIAGINNSVSISGDVERIVSANWLGEMIGGGVNVQSNVYDGLNTGVMSIPVTPDSTVFLKDIVNNINISGKVKQSVTANTIYSDLSASSGRQAFSTTSAQVMGNKNIISISGDVSKEINIGGESVSVPGSAVLVQANATPLGSRGNYLNFTSEIWDMIARTDNVINVSGNVIHNMIGGNQSSRISYDNINFSSVDLTANGINNNISVSGNVDRLFSGESTDLPLYSNSAVAIKANITQIHQPWGLPTLFSPDISILENTKNNINLSGNVNQSIDYQESRIIRNPDYPENNYEASTEFFATEIAAAGRNSSLLISGTTNSSVSISTPTNEYDTFPAHAGGVRLRNYYGDMTALITGNIIVSDDKDIANSLLDTTPPSRCLTINSNSCPGGMTDNSAIKFSSVGLRATNYGDSLNLVIEGDILSSGIGVQIRPFATEQNISNQDFDGELLSKGKGDIMVDIAAHIRGAGGYALEASKVTEGNFTLGLRDNWRLEGATYANYNNPGNTLLLHGYNDASLNLSRLSSVGEWQWTDSEDNLIGYTLANDVIANFHHLVKDGSANWTLTGIQKSGGFRDGYIRNGMILLDNAKLLMDKTSKDIAGNIDPSIQYSGMLTIDPNGILGVNGHSWIQGGDTTNNGLINLNTNHLATNDLTIDGNYSSKGGVIAFGTVLGSDTSATDHLTITGNSEGSGKISVTNIGGQGAQTIQGIELIKVMGDSDAIFTKASRIVAGAYDYDLVQKGNNWYLTSIISDEVAPGKPAKPIIRPEAGSYQANQIAANSLFQMRLHDRGGERQRKDPITGEEMKGMWMRHEFGKMRFRDSSMQLNSETNRYVAQIGMDVIEGSSNERNHLIGGVMAGYGHTSSTTRSNVDSYSSRGKTNGWSAGIYGTWFEQGETKEGAYADSWLLYSRFKNTVEGDELSSEKYWSDNIMASLELGYTVKLSETEYTPYHRRISYIQPQFQVIHTFGNDIKHKERNGTQINSDGDNSQFRFGVRAFMKEQWYQGNGNYREYEPYGEINWLTSNADYAVKMNETNVRHKGMKNILQLRAGVRGQITDNLSVWADATAQSGQQGYRDIMGQLGLKYDF